jgi:hypothetical protein
MLVKSQTALKAEMGATALLAASQAQVLHAAAVAQATTWQQAALAAAVTPVLREQSTLAVAVAETAMLAKLAAPV